MRKSVLAFFALALLLSACRIESNILLDINEDGSATVGAEIGFDEEMLNLVTQGGGDPGDILGDLPDLGGEDVEPINRVEGDMTYFGVSTKVDDLSTYDFGGLQGETFSEFSYEFDESSASLSATVDSSGLGELGGAEDLPIDPSEITGEVLSARVLVKMPGSVTESNADEVLSDGTLAWDLPFSGTKEIVAVSDFGSSSVSWIWFVVGAILIIGIIAVIAAVMTSRRDSEKAVAEAAAAHEEATASADESSTEETAAATVEPEEPAAEVDSVTSEEVSAAEEASEPADESQEASDDGGTPENEDRPSDA